MISSYFHFTLNSLLVSEISNDVISNEKRIVYQQNIFHPCQTMRKKEELCGGHDSRHTLELILIAKHPSEVFCSVFFRFSFSSVRKRMSKIDSHAVQSSIHDTSGHKNQIVE